MSVQLGTVNSPSGLDIPRDRYGRPLIVPADGGKPEPYTRASKFGDALEDTYNLSLWQQRMVLLGCVEADHLLLDAAAHRDDRTHLNRIVEEAKTAAQAHAGAAKGTALHRITEKIDRGEPTGKIPKDYLADVDAYRRATDGIQWLHLERFIVCDEVKAAGTADRYGIWNGRLVVGDTKTGSVDYPLKMAVQLAIYAHGKGYHPDTGRFDLGDVDKRTALIIHLAQGKGQCELRPLDIREGWQAAQLAVAVRAIRNASKKWLLPAVTGDDQALRDAIAAAADETALAALWRDNRHVWTADHTALAAARKNVLAATQPPVA